MENQYSYPQEHECSCNGNCQCEQCTCGHCDCNEDETSNTTPNDPYPDLPKLLWDADDFSDWD